MLQCLMNWDWFGAGAMKSATSNYILPGTHILNWSMVAVFFLAVYSLYQGSYIRLVRLKQKCHIYSKSLYTVQLFPVVIFHPSLILNLVQLLLCAGAASIFTLWGNLKSILPVWGPMTTAALQQIVFHPDDWELSIEECWGAKSNYQLSLLLLMLSRTPLLTWIMAVPGRSRGHVTLLCFPN